MRYSADIDRSIDSLAYCLQKVKNEVESAYDWRVIINAGGIDYGIYFNFDIKRKELEISNQPQYDETLYLDDIIEKINEYYNED